MTGQGEMLAKGAMLNSKANGGARLRTELAEQDNELEAARDDVLRLTAERDAARKLWLW